jgi:hypothetical protein
VPEEVTVAAIYLAYRLLALLLVGAMIGLRS